MRKMVLFAAVLLATIVAAPVAFADPGQNGPPGPAGNPNAGTTPAPQGPPASSPGNSANNPHGGAPGVTGQQPSPSTGSNAGGNGGGSANAPSSNAATQTAPPASTPPVTPGEPQGPPADVPRGNANGHDGSTGNDGTLGNGEPSPAGGPDGRITLCHATGSETNPFVEITISVNGLHGHGGHQDGEDMIPAPAGGCEQPAIPPAGAFGNAEWTSPAAPEPETRQSDTPASGDEPTGEVLGESEFGEAGTKQTVVVGDDDEVTPGGVEGSSASGATADAPNKGELPFTGFVVGGLLLTGLALLASGHGLRRWPRSAMK